MIEYLERACPEIHSGFTYDDGMLDGFDQWLKKFPLLIDQAVPDSDSLSFLNFILESNVIGHFINSTVVGAEHTLIDEDTVEKFHQRGMLAGAYTLFPEDKRYLNGTTRNSESEAIRLAAAGYRLDRNRPPRKATGNSGTVRT